MTYRDAYSLSFGGVVGAIVVGTIWYAAAGTMPKLVPAIGAFWVVIAVTAAIAEWWGRR